MGMLSSPCSAVVMPRYRIGDLPKERCPRYCSVPDAVRSASEVALGKECGDARCIVVREADVPLLAVAGPPP